MSATADVRQPHAADGGLRVVRVFLGQIHRLMKRREANPALRQFAELLLPRLLDERMLRAAVHQHHDGFRAVEDGLVRRPRPRQHRPHAGRLFQPVEHQRAVREVFVLPRLARRLAGEQDNFRELGILGVEFERLGKAPRSKHQAPEKHQAPNTGPARCRTRAVQREINCDAALVFGHWSLVLLWSLELGVWIFHERISFTTCPLTSVSRKGRPSNV